jgi:hypothetical protein
MLKNSSPHPLLVLTAAYSVGDTAHLTCLHTHVYRLTGEKSGAWASPDD